MDDNITRQPVYADITDEYGYVAHVKIIREGWYHRDVLGGAVHKHSHLSKMTYHRLCVSVYTFKEML